MKSKTAALAIGLLAAMTLGGITAGAGAASAGAVTPLEKCTQKRFSTPRPSAPCKHYGPGWGWSTNPYAL